MNIYWDVETYSECNLKKCGAYIYAAASSTGVHFLCYAIDNNAVETWHPGDPVPAVFANPTGHKFISDNWEFEGLILTHVLIPRYGFVQIPLKDQDCAQRLALANAYPAELGLRCKALGLPFKKDSEARKAMLRLARMHKYKRPEDRTRDLALVLQRCKADVESTRAAYNGAQLRPLLPEERHLLLLDAEINARGICTNTPFLEAAYALATKERAAVDSRVNELTEGTITSVFQVRRIMETINARGHAMTSLGKRSVASTLAHKPEDFARELLELRQRGAFASVQKFKKLQAFADPHDRRIRGSLRIYGAGPGRWTSLGAQLHNLKRNDAEHPASLVDALIAGDRAELARYGNPLDVVGNLTRAALCAAPGHVLICADFGAIESRVLAWLAGERWKLDVFRQFDATKDPRFDLYRVIAARLLRKNIDSISKAERQTPGKGAELSCGFGGSVGAWRRIIKDDSRTDAEIKADVTKWRAEHPAIRKFWQSLARAARVAIRTKRAVLVAPAPQPPITAAFDGEALTLTLPSGRAINYPSAQLVPNHKFEDGESDIEHFDNAIGKWRRVRTWYGTLTENVVQGTARDLLAAGIIRAEARGWKVVFHCHDELVVEAPEGSLSEQEVLACMLEPPSWAGNLPLGGKVHGGPLYLEALEPREPPPKDEIERAVDMFVADVIPLAATKIADEIASDVAETINAPEEGIISLEASTFDIPAPPIPPPSSPSSPPTPSPARGNGRGNGFAGDGYPASERDDVGQPVAEYIYRDLKGAPYLKVVKRRSKDGKKYFPQYHLEAGKWVKGKPDGPAIPYRLPELLAAPANATVEIPEGEKDANNLAALGLIATTNPGGAGKWTPELTKWFSGFARANVYEDHDTAGRKHVSQVAAALAGTIPDIRVIQFREMSEHSDVSDWLKTGKTLAQLLERTGQAPKFAAFESVCAADEEIEDYDWVWPGRFALKKIGLITGLPDEGKGVLLSDIIARVTRGLSWPCDEGTAPIGNVILFTAEDDSKDTIVPRLMAAGADLKRVTIIKMLHEAGKERMFSLVTDLPILRQKAIEIGNVKMIVIDPVSAYLGIGKVDSFRATDVRAVLGPLKEFAEELRLFILGVIHFNKKMDVTNLLLRVSDSLAYTAAARHVYGIVNDEDNQRKLFVKGKNNIAPREQQTLAFGFNTREVGTDKRTGNPISRPFIVWEDQPVDITATEALQALNDSKSPSARDNAKQFLKALLTGEPVGSKDVKEAAKENGISIGTLRRAAEDLGVDIKKDGPVNEKNEITWRWHLPTKKEDDK
jgi:DNA polymerase